MPISPLARVRKFCLALAGTEEKIAWGEPTWRAGGRIYAMYASSGSHHTDGRSAVWLKCTPTNQEFILRANSSRYFKPPYVGPVGWIGAYVEGRVNWREIESLIEDAYELNVPPRKKPAPPRRTSKRTRR
jgi:predicted DNA-binding protein (MmcQ/YjbR family)